MCLILTEEDKENDEDCEPFYTTVEERELFTSAYPDVMEQFMVAMEMKKSKGEIKFHKCNLLCCNILMFFFQ